MLLYLFVFQVLFWLYLFKHFFLLYCFVIIEIQIFYKCLICNHFLLLQKGICRVLLWWYLLKNKGYNLVKHDSSILSFMSWAFVTSLRKKSPNIRAQNFSPKYDSLELYIQVYYPFWIIQCPLYKRYIGWRHGGT